MLDVLAPVATSRKVKRPGTSGVKVGLRTDADERIAAESTGRRITLHCQDVAV
jgi:hypothetical protein